MIKRLIDMQRSFPVLLFFLFLNLCLETYAQVKSELISGVFKDMPVEQFARQVESISDYHFYYDQKQFDSLRITIEVHEKSLPSILEDIFKDSDYHYAVYGTQVFLSRGKQILTSLPQQFRPGGVPDRIPFPGSGQVAGLSDNSPDTLTSAPENKIYTIGTKSQNPSNAKSTLTGTIKNAKTGMPVNGATVFAEDLSVRTVTNAAGVYTLTLPAGRHILSIRNIGMNDTRRIIVLNSSGTLNIDVQDRVFALNEVVVSSVQSSNVRSTQMGVEKLSIATIKQVPVVFGEADVLKVILTLPGVKSVGEASTGFNVRGGAVDQNLILFNDATIYNPSHFFGFFSAFNPDAVKDIELYKSDIPAKYGGRLASVLEVTSREGDKKEFKGTAGIGLLTSRINIEGPIKKDKTSFLFGARTTYSNWLLGIMPGDYRDAHASFYDMNMNISHQFNAKNDLSVTGYISHDKSDLATDTNYAYSNKNISARWRHTFNKRLYGIFTGGIDNYGYESYSDYNMFNTAYRLKFNISQANLKTDFNYRLNDKHTVDFGLGTIYYKLKPGSLTPYNGQSQIAPDVIQSEQALESAVYLSDRFDLNSKLSFNIGARYSLFNAFGPSEVSQYAPGLPLDEANVVNRISYGSGDAFKTYSGPELRLSGRYALTNDFSIKAGYNTSRQYIHLLTNTTSMSPTDVWKLSDYNIKPQLGQQISFGLYKNFNSNTIETSVETYYKRMQDYLDYRSGARLIMNHHIEQDVIGTKGKAYGIEFMIKKETGNLNGWLSYTYARTFLKMDDPAAIEKINGGNYYPANSDMPHAFNLTTNYRFTHRYSLSLNVVYSTGRPITLPVGKFYYEDAQRILYSDRNEFRIADYFRTDLSFLFEGNHKLDQLFHSSWTIGVYNLTAQKNPYSNFYLSERNTINGYKLVIFGTPVPYINYNIRFR